ncbi:peptidoglycan D,D-transpeptidase FtsI family protein [Halobacillus sp. MO56]
MNSNRLILYMISLLVVFSILIYRLMDIQLFNTEHFGEANVNLLQESTLQRTSKIELSDGRGLIVDRYGNPMNKKVEKDVVMFPFINEVEEIKNVLKEIIGVDQSVWNDWFSKEEEAFFLTDKGYNLTEEQLDRIDKASFPGVMVVKKESLPDRESIPHLIGMTGEGEESFLSSNETELHGISGLEAAFDRFLASEETQTAQYHIDAMGNPLLGLGMRLTDIGNPFYPLSITTTIDMKLQQKLHAILQDMGIIEGGVVLLDVKSREVLAMISRPDISVTELYEEQKSIKNRMLTSYPPGSIFKTVIAAAAIENYPGLLKTKFDCNKSLYGTGEDARKLGLLSFEDSFAQSCNYTFAETARKLIKLDNEVIENYANKLGLINPVGWEGKVYHYKNFRQIPEEERGNVWGADSDRSVPRAISQTAIGQKNVKVTPLSIANMMATIADDGVIKQVRAVQRITYENNTELHSFESDSSQALSGVTALKLQELLEKVVDEGTGRQLSALPIAGKSGTAETGKEGVNHYWFAGYFPREEPEYAMAVVELNQRRDEQQIYTLYAHLAQEVLRHKMKD